jgi:hypothetical protein
VAKLHVLEAPKNSLVGSVVRLPFREFFDSSCTKLNKCQWHHFECAQAETAAFLCVFMKSEQKKVATLHVLEAPKNKNQNALRARNNRLCHTICFTCARVKRMCIVP